MLVKAGTYLIDRAAQLIEFRRTFFSVRKRLLKLQQLYTLVAHGVFCRLNGRVVAIDLRLVFFCRPDCACGRLVGIADGVGHLIERLRCFIADGVDAVLKTPGAVG